MKSFPANAAEAALAFYEDGLRQSAQPAFATGIAKKPAHPAERTGDGAFFVAGKN
jgi:hypothetical protein